MKGGEIRENGLQNMDNDKQRRGIKPVAVIEKQLPAGIKRV